MACRAMQILSIVAQNRYDTAVALVNFVVAFTLGSI